MVDAAEKEYNNTSLIKFLMNKIKKACRNSTRLRIGFLTDCH